MGEQPSDYEQAVRALRQVEQNTDISILITQYRGGGFVRRGHGSLIDVVHLLVDAMKSDSYLRSICQLAMDILDLQDEADGDDEAIVYDIMRVNLPADDGSQVTG